MMRFLVVLAFISVTVGDEYYYNMREWVEPVFVQLQKRALYGMKETPKLNDILWSTDSDLVKLDSEIRRKVALHLQQEFGHILNRMQKLIDIVKSFSLDMASNLQVAAKSMVSGFENADEVGTIYVNELIRRAKQAIKEIVVHLEYETAEDVEDHLSGQVFQSLAVRIAKQVLDGAEFSNMEMTVMKQIEKVLDSVFNDEDNEIESGVMSDVVEDLRTSLRLLTPHIRGQEAEFSSWMKQLITDGVSGARPQLKLLHGYAKQVISEGCKLCQSVCEKAYKYFADYKEEMSQSWSRMEKIVHTITDENPV